MHATTPTTTLTHPLVRLRGDKIVDGYGRAWVQLLDTPGDFFVCVRFVHYDESLTLQAAIRLARREIERRRRENQI